MNLDVINMSNEYIDDEYGEDEWDREQLLDPAWEKQQKKVCPLKKFFLTPPTFSFR